MGRSPERIVLAVRVLSRIIYHSSANGKYYIFTPTALADSLIKSTGKRLDKTPKNEVIIFT